MIQYSNGGILLQTPADFYASPVFREWPGKATNVYKDYETSSHDPKKDSLNPFHNCWIAGVAITIDDCPNAYYIPFQDYPPDDQRQVYYTLAEIDRTAQFWINHNVKYDAHAEANNTPVEVYGYNSPAVLVCTLNAAKLIDSDRIVRGGYGLDALSDSWLGENISRYELALKPFLKNNKDYGAIPADIIGEYACQDVLTNRKLWQYILDKLPAECFDILNVEIRLTRRLFETERNGMRVTKNLQLQQLLCLNRMANLDEKLTQLVGHSFRPHVSEDCFDVLCNQFGLPIMAYTKDKDGEETSNASFDKHALELYLGNPYAPLEVVQGIKDYRKDNQFNNLFLEAWQELLINQHLHPAYNQTVRTGRMSCVDPNAQQLSDLAKELIVPDDGFALIVADASQIEFRHIVHYINNEKAIAAYIANPDTDFHVWVAEMCGIPRKPAKTINFLTGFGGGKKKLLGTLTKSPELVMSIKAEVDAAVASGECVPEKQLAMFAWLAEKRAEGVYTTYHSVLPELKPTSRFVEGVLKERGHVKTMYKRHRHLPIDFAYRAFNTLNQGSAADFFKDRTVDLCDMLDGTPITMKALVHDAVVMQAPIDVANDPQTRLDIIALLESPRVQLKVPVRWSWGVSSVNWKQADDNGKENYLHYNPADARYLDHLR